MHLEHLSIAVTFISYPGTQLSALYGIKDLLVIADRLACRRLGRTKPTYQLEVLELDEKTLRSGVMQSVSRESAAPSFIVLLPSLGAMPDFERMPGLIKWLKDRHADGSVLASVCVGAFVLAQTGLLAGRPATTHWDCADQFAKAFPEVDVDTTRLMIEDGDIITAGGLMAWTDLGLAIVRRTLGAAAMIETARYVLIDPPGREQRYYYAFAPKLDHGDAAIVKAQHFIQKNAGVRVTIKAIAACAGLEERTFLRRFKDATGLKPLEYCLNIRVSRARDLLELTRRPLGQIAHEMGYEDLGSFQKVFRAITGLTAGDYRRRFGTPLSTQPSNP